MGIFALKLTDFFTDKIVIADTGYFSDDSLKKAEDNKINAYIPDQNFRKIDTPEARDIYSRRMGIIEPVFADICVHKGLNKFTLRGKDKVNIQWLLFCIVHNLGKIAKYGDLKALKISK